MTYLHANLAAGRWQTLPLLEQLANVGSDVARAARWYGKDPQRCEQAFLRAWTCWTSRLPTTAGRDGGEN